MPIESRIPTEDINVKDLQIEQPEGEPVGLSFDFEKELDSETLQLMHAQLKESLQFDSSYEKVLNMGLLFKYLTKEFPAIEKDLDKYWQKIPALFFDKIHTSKGEDEHWDFVTRVGVKIKFLFPEKFQELFSDWKAEEKDLTEYINDGNVSAGVSPSIFENGVMLFPNLRKTEYAQTQGQRNLELMQEVVNERHHMTMQPTWLARFKLAWPDQFKHLRFPAGYSESLQGQIEVYKSQLTDVQEEKGGDYSNMLFNLAIVTAKKAELANKGLEFEFYKPQNLSDRKTALPEIKKF